MTRVPVTLTVSPPAPAAPAELLMVFLLGDAVGCAVAGQKVPEGHYRLDRMLASGARHGAEMGCCGTCLDARGITGTALVTGAHRSSLDELTRWTVWADQVITF
jgi:uncharacterized protein involved in oxidation of intracellular sulfur